MNTRPSLSLTALGLLVALAQSCVDEIPAVGGVGGHDGSGAVGAAVQASSVVGAGGASLFQGPCGFFVDLEECSVDDSVPDVVDQAGAEAALVGTWRRCDDTEPGFFDVGVRFQEDGRAYRLYRRPNDVGGSAENLVYCGVDMSDGGVWSLNDKSAEGFPDEYDLTIAWDNGEASTFDLQLYGSLAGLGLFDAFNPSAPDLFAPEGPPL